MNIAIQEAIQATQEIHTELFFILFIAQHFQPAFD